MSEKQACCCWYHKGTNFQANHNSIYTRFVLLSLVADTTKVRIFKQFTTGIKTSSLKQSCCWYHKGTNFQANHNYFWNCKRWWWVVADTTKVRIFKQITTTTDYRMKTGRLLLIPQRYEFSSKSQRAAVADSLYKGCCWYHKGTNFQANHNSWCVCSWGCSVVADTTKVRIFKQITTQHQKIN